MLCLEEVAVASLVVALVVALVRTRPGGCGRCKFPVVLSDDYGSRFV
jgi:hypothetical protein